MKFLCDNCQAQYMIADEKVGSAGVRVRCKKCSHVIFVKRLEEEAPSQDSTVVVSQEKMAQLSASSATSDGDSAPVTVALPAEPPPPPVAASPAEPAAGLEDEIGQALDSMFSDTNPPAPAAGAPKPSGGSRPPVVLGPSPLSRVPVSPFGGTDASKGADTLSFEAPELTQIVSPPAASTPAAAGGSKPTEWFIAVHDEQVGPLKVGDIKERFEKGEVGSDTLVWAIGLTDWRPLSNVEELAELILPKREIVRISRLPLPAEPPKEPPKKEPIAFRPSAASALASLASMAKEEIAASERALPPPPRAAEPTASRGPELPSSAFLAGLPAPPPSSTAIPVAPPPAPSPSAVDYRSSPLAQTKPRREGRRRSAIVGSVIVAAVVLLAGAAGATYFFVIKPQREIEARLEQQQRLDAQRAKEDEKARQDALAAAPAPKPAAAAVVPAPVPSPPVAIPSPSPVARTAPPPEPAPRTESGRDRHGKHGKGGKSGGETAVAETSVRPATPAPAKGSGGDDLLAAGDVDKEFAKEIEGGNDNKPAKHGPYIPPPPGQGDLPVSLSQAEIVGAVSSHRDAFARCVQEQKKRDPSATGTVVMRWRIRPDGRSTDIAAKGEDYADSPLAGCFKGQIAKLHFGAYRGAQMAPIEFPFSF